MLVFRRRGWGGWRGLIRGLLGGIIVALLLIVLLKLFFVLVWMTGGLIVLVLLGWLAWKWFQ